MPAIELDDISKKYGDTTALYEMSLTIENGELFGLIGDNGSGKTTTINVLTGQLKPDSGSAVVLGINATEEPTKVREKVGILPEREEPPGTFTPREYFEFIGEVHGIPRRELDQRIDEWASRLDFKGDLDTRNQFLSRGQKQMVMITQAFLSSPELIVIDEPLVNLDPARQERVKQALLEYQSAGNTILLSTHRMDFVEEVCTRVGIVRNGKIATVVNPNDFAEGKGLSDYFAEYAAPLPDVSDSRT